MTFTDLLINRCETEKSDYSAIANLPEGEEQ